MITIACLATGATLTIFGLALWLWDVFDRGPMDWEPGPWDLP